MQSFVPFVPFFHGPVSITSTAALIGRGFVKLSKAERSGACDMAFLQVLVLLLRARTTVDAPARSAVCKGDACFITVQTVLCTVRSTSRRPSQLQPRPRRWRRPPPRYPRPRRSSQSTIPWERVTAVTMRGRYYYKDKAFSTISGCGDLCTTLSGACVGYTFVLSGTDVGRCYVLRMPRQAARCTRNKSH